jgi:Na+/melibiose symporter-like transporter
MCLMDALPSLLVMQLKDHAISNQAIAVLMTLIATVCNTCLNPVISYSSDRYRSRWGRRRPLLMFVTPFVTLFLIVPPMFYSVALLCSVVLHRWKKPELELEKLSG